jgi:hypothetical protein
MYMCKYVCIIHEQQSECKPPYAEAYAVLYAVLYAVIARLSGVEARASCGV